MKQFAFYLPQFHEIEENNKWWGKGFTEWTNVRKARKLYKDHYQPNLPLNHNYYNLLDKNTVVWQTNLMKQYGIEGFIYYHYYFKGNLLLEQPAENLLKWKDIPQKFFFCWANHTWYRSWKGEKTTLIEQTYGREKEWEQHFKYLLPFFLDVRYEKKDNKPVFMIYDPEFECRVDMLRYFNKRCIEEGFAGIWAIETCKSIEKYNSISRGEDFSEQFFFREPSVCLSEYSKTITKLSDRIINKMQRMMADKGVGPCVRKYSGDVLYEFMKTYITKYNNVIKGGFFEWDNTPRHGSRGFIITPPEKENYLSYMDMVQKEEYFFINAWNEWAEGMMLEPTERRKYTYLEWISEWKRGCDK